MVGAINLFDEYDVSHNTTKAGGNAVSVLRLISATASMYSHITLVSIAIIYTQQISLHKIKCLLDFHAKNLKSNNFQYGIISGNFSLIFNSPIVCYIFGQSDNNSQCVLLFSHAW